MSLGGFNSRRWHCVSCETAPAHSGRYGRRETAREQPETERSANRPPRLVIREDDLAMTYVPFEEKTAAQREADRKADERWMRDHAPVYENTPIAARYYRPGVEMAPAAPSAH